MSETPEEPAYPAHMEKAPAGLFEHSCTKVAYRGGRSDLTGATGWNGIAARIKTMRKYSELA